ncbi:PLP-dependent transferase [Neoehrlichia mikurensis]|uniref:PLP-dependent aspartate aminotransferase family protein n=1 Tax=Neoehrlichia mikurensis TaxID=89586 RepID=A0A9Q9F348_9RICK|nr:PLP-dependent aspartate aminotransferase family protein [Neoehrlichia mikurensis]QXK92151.1 PLP-dependent transferase [Neoehrlichia mikurensis]QXK92608.1 PLP-dependent transferase [Neoehrlichia mikurensis]QXK93845.1 PLP-dependent transferase [Neoehrlichia mikurensis]UTO55160.1 PLP-dependent aspartate aminotransferase family protein [Neoehrlichia mikurensis]UTO56080.1 PLP-dependent aspartate aminotransferase family protein [Neoehrlichia mikurensis]
MEKDSTIFKKSKNFYGSLNIPIYRSSTILFSNFTEFYNAQAGSNIYNISHDDIIRDYSYSSVGSPTCHYLSNAIAALEEGKYAIIYPSGLMCLTLLSITFTGNNAHILVPNNVYFRYKNFVNEVLLKNGTNVTFYDPVQDISPLIQKNTSLIMIESPNSTTLTITDISPIVELAKKHNIITICDNSCAPLLYKPLKYNIDIVVYSLTKYFSGHSDVLMGAIITNNKALFQKLYNTYKNFGVFVSPDDCYLVYRGLKTMHIRIEQCQNTAKKLALWLQKHQKIKQVIYPTLPSHPQHHIWKKYCSTGGGGLLNIILHKQYSENAINTAFSDMKYFGIGSSWGGCTSLILPKHNNSQESCLRIFCGLEDPQNLIHDLESSLAKL